MKGALFKRKTAVIAVALILSVLSQLAMLEFIRWQGTSSRDLHLPSPKRQLQARFDPRIRPPEKKKEEPEPPPEGTIVDIPKPVVEKRPEETRHLAKYDVDTRKEQKSRIRAPRTKPQRSERPVKRESEAQSPESESPAPTRTPRDRAEREPPKADPDLKPSDRGERMTSPELVRGSQQHLLQPSSDESATLANIQMLSQQFSSDDALLDVMDEADETLLKARSFRYWDFFQRVRERVREHWNPQRVHRQRDPTGRIYGVKDRLTMLRVTLDSDGRLLKVDIHKPSGLDFLDEEARNALRAAAPFHNPPKGLMDEYGQMTFTVGFLFEIGSSRHRFFWNRM